ncbi:MAG: glycine zipper 2TM domain-containing protein [Holosporales bacterium]|jgi:outer membrane lipoprotein SlyB|nr:glycine zipper 2TM domain-containing protein [Holosporales bacterium]
MRVVAAIMVAAAVLVTGCSNSEFSGNTYNSANAGEVSRSAEGVITSIREVDLQPKDSMAGTALGAVGGGIAGSMFGGGHAKIMTAAAGAVAGGVLGNKLATRTEKGNEYTVKLKDGSVIVIAQAKDPPLSVGQAVRVVYSNRDKSRLIAA